MRFDVPARPLAVHGQLLPLDPPHTTRGATVGGIIAANSSGFGRYRYGGVRDLLLGVRAALPDGTIARAGGRVVKNVAGYDLNKLFVGSLGTLGVIVEATFKILPIPPVTPRRPRSQARPPHSRRRLRSSARRCGRPPSSWSAPSGAGAWSWRPPASARRSTARWTSSPVSRPPTARRLSRSPIPRTRSDRFARSSLPRPFRCGGIGLGLGRAHQGSLAFSMIPDAVERVVEDHPAKRLESRSDPKGVISWSIAGCSEQPAMAELAGALGRAAEAQAPVAPPTPVLMDFVTELGAALADAPSASPRERSRTTDRPSGPRRVGCELEAVAGACRPFPS